MKGSARHSFTHQVLLLIFLFWKPMLTITTAHAVCFFPRAVRAKQCFQGRKYAFGALNRKWVKPATPSREGPQGIKGLSRQRRNLWPQTGAARRETELPLRSNAGPPWQRST